MAKMADITGLRIEDIQALVQGAGPNAAPSIDEQGAYRVAGQPVLIAALTAVLADRVAIVTVEAVFGPQPQVTLRVLQDAVDGALREPIAHREMLEIHGSHCRRR